MSDIKAEPIAWGMPATEFEGVVDCITPWEHEREQGGYTIPLYTADAIRAAVLAERERWTEAVMGELDGNGQAQAIVAYAIRKEPTT